MISTMKHSTPVSIIALIMLLGLATGCSDKTAEEKGAAMAAEKIDMVKGMGTVLEDKGAQAAESLTSGLGKVVKGVEKGIEKSGRTLVIDSSLMSAGLQVTKIQNLSVGASEGHGLEAYLVSNAAGNGELLIKVFDAMDREIGRSRVPVQTKTDDAGYIAIPLDTRVPLATIAKVAIEYQPKVIP